MQASSPWQPVSSLLFLCDERGRLLPCTADALFVTNVQRLQSNGSLHDVCVPTPKPATVPAREDGGCRNARPIADRLGMKRSVGAAWREEEERYDDDCDIRRGCL